MTTVYCQQCAHPFPIQASEIGARWTCPGCKCVHYQDPKVAVGVLVGDGRQVLLTLRNHDPRRGYWSFPAGFVDRGEVVEEAALREVREETGLDVAIEGLVGVYSRAGDPVIFIAYSGRETGGKLTPGEEAESVAYFAVEALPPLAFPRDREIIESWRHSALLAVT